MRNRAKDLVVVAAGALGVLYLINPTAGFLELLPDPLPLVGNLDEATATVLVVSALRYFGVDAARLFSRGDDTVEGRARRK